jgi:chromosome segregation ATPase
MSTADPPDDTSAERPTQAEPAKSRKPWIWLSALLAIVAAGLLIWALTIQSDLDSANQELDSAQQQLAAANDELDGTKKQLDATKQDVEELQAQADEGVGTGAAVVGATALYKEFSNQLGATEDDLASTQQDLEAAEKAAAQAEKDAKAAQQAAADAGNETEKAQAEADQARAELKAAESRSAIAADCAKAYFSAVGVLFDGESTSDQQEKVREQLSAITATCKDELAAA